MTDEPNNRIPSPVLSADLSDFSYEQIKKKEQIGTGGDANVYRGIISQNDTEYTIAVKEPRFEGTIQQEVMEQFEREAETWSKLDDHPNIVTVYSWGMGSLPWLGLEYMDGGTLESHLGDFAIEEALWLAGRIAEGIQQGHRHGVAHLDLKPSNILLRKTPDGKFPYPKVSDWGLAKLLLEHSKSVEGLSPTYAAPEQFDTEEYGKTDNITDIYQFGTILYALCTGEPPFTGSTTSVMQDILTKAPTPPSDHNPKISDELDEILLKALSKKKKHRHESIVLLRKQLDEQFNEYSEIEEFDNLDNIISSPPPPSSGADQTNSEQNSPGEIKSNTVTKDTSGGLISRRTALSVLGAGAIGIGGVRYLQSGAMQQTTQTEPQQTTQTEADSADTNQVEQVWNTTIEGRIYHAPVLRDGILYALTSDTTLHAISIEGEQLWAESPSNAEKTKSGPAVGSNGICFGDTGGNVYKYDFDGNKKWIYEANNTISRPPTIADGAVYVTAESNAVVKLDATDGTTRWRLTKPESGFVVSTPEVGDKRIYVGGFDDLRAINKSTGDIDWQYESLDPIKPTPTYSPNHVYSGTDGDRVFAFDSNDGSEQWSASVSAAVWTSPGITNKRVIAGTNDGKVFGLNREDGSIVWQLPAGSPVQADPVIDRSSAYIVSKDGTLLSINATDGTVQWEHATNSRFEAHPQLTSDGNILLAGFEGTLRLITPP